MNEMENLKLPINEEPASVHPEANKATAEDAAPKEGKPSLTPIVSTDAKPVRPAQPSGFNPAPKPVQASAPPAPDAESEKEVPEEARRLAEIIRAAKQDAPKAPAASAAAPEAKPTSAAGIKTPIQTAPPSFVATPAATQRILTTNPMGSSPSAATASVITKGTHITGQVKTDGSLDVMGVIDGNIEAEGNVRISGKVTGDIKGVRLDLISCQVKGNLTATSEISINNESIVVGDIQTENIEFDGRIKGNISISNTATLNSNAYLLGDITTQTISISNGAVVNGQVKMLSKQEDDKLFENI